MNCIDVDTIGTILTTTYPQMYTDVTSTRTGRQLYGVNAGAVFHVA